MSQEKSKAHLNEMNHCGDQMWPDGLIDWHPQRPPDLSKNASRYNTGRLRACGYCGSMHPADVAQAIRAGALGKWADRKYGWPHKVYFEDIPNPFEGMKEVRSSCSGGNGYRPDGEGWELRKEPRYNERTGERVADYETWIQVSTAGPTIWGKFYSIHLMDASPEDRETIEKHVGLHFEFTDDGRIRWMPFE